MKRNFTYNLVKCEVSKAFVGGPVNESLTLQNLKDIDSF